MDVETGVTSLPKQMQEQGRRQSAISLWKISADHPAFKGCDEKTISTIISELAKVDVNNDGERVLRAAAVHDLHLSQPPLLLPRPSRLTRHL
mmetsp:Transcript_34143/g.76872  ORF Transcript_34143/g.76872 Transcript_34143/m.76872 type:complete len:92 (+) Transcript_34143:104-379(+)